MSPSLQTMGFFMSDINFCNTKEQLNHLGEVVTGKASGSPTGADIDTSTLPYTGQVRKTLTGLEKEYRSTADSAIDQYRLLSKGPYAAGILLEDKFQYITYNGESYFAVNPPYTTTATTPDADGNLFAGGYTTFENVANKIGNKNELSNSNFLTPSPDAITHPNATPEAYVAGTQIFSGVYAGASGATITFINGRVNCTAGSYQFKLANTGGLERVPVFTSSVSDYDGSPKTTGVSHALVGDEYVVTVTPVAVDVFSVKLEQGGVATRHEVASSSIRKFNTIQEMIDYSPPTGSIVSVVNEDFNVKYKVVSNANPDLFAKFQLESGFAVLIANQDIPTKAFGAKHDGATNDRDSLRYAAEYMAGTGFSLISSPGQAMVDSVPFGVEPPANTKICFAKGSSWKALPTNSDSYAVLSIVSDDIEVHEPVLYGERDEHTGVGGEQGHCLNISGSPRNVTVIRPRCYDAWGDGIAHRNSIGCKIIDPIVENCRRQGITINAGENLRVVRPVCKNINGTSPMAGIDIEPNSGSDMLIDVRIIEPYTENCGGAGIVAGFTTHKGLDIHHDISIDSHHDIGSAGGFSLSPLDGDIDCVQTGFIRYSNPILEMSRSYGIQLDSYSSENTVPVYIDYPKIIDANTDDNSATFGCGIIASNANGGLLHGVGNITIRDPEIIDTRAVPLIKRGIRYNDIKGHDVPANFKVVAPANISVDGEGVNDMEFTTSVLEGSFVDPNKAIRLNCLLDQPWFGSVITLFTTIGLAAPCLLREESSIQRGYEFTISVNSGSGITFRPFSTKTIPLLGLAAGQSLSCTDNGASITLIERVAGRYDVVSVTGTWNVV